MWPRDGKEKTGRVPPAWLQVYSWVSPLTIFIQHDYLLRIFFFISSVSYCQFAQSFTFFKPMICFTDLEGHLKNYYCDLHCVNMILVKVFYLFIYIVSIYFSIYKGLLFFFYTNRFNPTKDQVENISWVLYWTEALINTWPCIKSRSAARVKIFNERKLLQEKKKKQRSEQYVDDYIHYTEGISLFFHLVGFYKEMIKFTLKMFWVSWFGNTWCINLLYSFVIYFWKPVFALSSFCSL